MAANTHLVALGLNCTLKRSPEVSSTDVLLGQVMDALAGHGVSGDTIRLGDHAVHPGVRSDEGDGDV